MRNGYLTTESIARPDRFALALDDHFDDVRVGVHDAMEVVHGHDWLGSVQVFTSTLAASGYGRLNLEDPANLAIVTGLLRAAYAGTLLASASLGKSYVVLTLIGGAPSATPSR